MSPNIEKIQAYIRELNAQRAAYAKKAPRLISRLYGRGKDDRKPDTVNDSSFLYIRSYEGDVGVRPFDNILFWNSPDINISPVTDIGNFGTTIHAGHTYNINCRLHNRGDITVPFPKVEFFLTTPTLGFDTRFADLIGLTQLPGLLLPAGSDTLDFRYHVPAAMEGHKCLFARTYSFSPLDKPNDVYALQPTSDRHIAQKNLNFVPQNTEYQFNLIHLPNTQEQIEFVPMSKNKVLQLLHPTILKYRISNQLSLASLRKLEVRPIGKIHTNFRMKPGKQGIELYVDRGKGVGIDEQARLMKAFHAMLKAPVSRMDRAERRKLHEAVTAMNKPMMKTSFNVAIPDFGLKPGQLAGIDIVNTNRVTGERKGGITLLVTG
ncbi:MAG TPA: hypothetical protein VNQ80_17960 [Parapedobacter sp.]|uniref:hypothetical protein n=1 Tax=Parapedobacter sp. TaxID=1958893 RepID=UPI002C434E0C|nr:hypothetical protein [Parapedobacter sp.]HWK59234.1 hypothetical protein [Parapedobacter sp.]